MGLIWEFFNLILCIVGMLCAVRIFLLLVRQKPWAANVRLRCFLVLSIAAADVLFGLLTMTASAAILLGLDDESEGVLFCQLLGPMFDFTTFLLYMTVANLAHYSLYRLHERKIDKRELLRRYVLVALIVAAALAAIVTYTVFAESFDHGFRLTNGMCAIAGYNATVVITLLERICEVYILFVFVQMARKARKHHAPLVVLRQQRIASGYIAVALFQGCLYHHSFKQNISN